MQTFTQDTDGEMARVFLVFELGANYAPERLVGAARTHEEAEEMLRQSIGWKGMQVFPVLAYPHTASTLSKVTNTPPRRS